MTGGSGNGALEVPARGA